MAISRVERRENLLRKSVVGLHYQQFPRINTRFLGWSQTETGFGLGRIGRRVSSAT